MYFDALPPRILGHRGASGLAPENTLESFELALQYSSYIETDCWLTADGTPIFFHDATLERVAGVPKAISECSLAEIQSVDVAKHFVGSTADKPHRVPTVKETFEKFPDAFFNIELKDPRPGAAEALFKVIQETGMQERVLLAAEDDDIMDSIRKIAPDVPTSASRGEVLDFITRYMQGDLSGFESPSVAFQIPDSFQGQDLGVAEIIEAIHSAGKEVHYWTINDAERMKELVESGADGIVTDFPNLSKDFALST